MGAFLATLVAVPSVLHPRQPIPFPLRQRRHPRRWWSVPWRASARRIPPVDRLPASIRYRLTVAIGRRRLGEGAAAAVEEQEAQVRGPPPTISWSTSSVAGPSRPTGVSSSTASGTGPGSWRGGSPTRSASSATTFPRSRAAPARREAVRPGTAMRWWAASGRAARGGRYAPGGGRDAAREAASAGRGQAVARRRDGGDGRFSLPLRRDGTVGAAPRAERGPTPQVPSAQQAGEPVAHARRRPGVLAAGGPLLDAYRQVLSGRVTIPLAADFVIPFEATSTSATTKSTPGGRSRSRSPCQDSKD